MFAIKDIKELYIHRFSKKEQLERKRIWKVLCRNFFQLYIDEKDTVLDLGAGYCDFINNIRAGRKIAVDQNPEIQRFAGGFVNVYICSSTNLPKKFTEEVDIVFASNFFEHLPSKEDIVETLNEVKRVLKDGGKIIILLPNINYVGSKYWDFLDHQLPLSEKSIAEALMISGFRILESRARFLPYTTKSKLPKFNWVIKLYLKIRLLHLIFGKQSLIVAQK